MFERSWKAFCLVVVFHACVMAGIGFDSEDELSLSGLTQEDPKYIDVVGETSDEGESSNLSAIFACAKKLAGDDTAVTSVVSEESRSEESIHSNISEPFCEELGGHGAKKRMRYSEGITNKEVCTFI